MACGLLAASLSLALAGSGGVYVGTQSVKVLGQPGHRSALSRTNTMTVVVGSYYQVAGAACFALQGGVTATNVTIAPPAGGDLTDGTVIWRPVLAQERKALAVINDSTNTEYCSVGAPAVASACMRLNGPGGSFSLAGPGVPQGEVFAVSGVSSNVVLTTEW